MRADRLSGVQLPIGLKGDTSAPAPAARALEMAAVRRTPEEVRAAALAEGAHPGHAEALAQSSRNVDAELADHGPVKVTRGDALDAKVTGDTPHEGINIIARRAQNLGGSGATAVVSILSTI